MGIYKSAYSGRQVDDAVARTSALNYNSTDKVLTVNGESDLQITQMGTDDKSVATKKYVDEHAANVNIENGTGSNSIQQTQDGTTGTFDFTNKNAIATSLDPTLTGQIAYGGVGAYSSVTGGKAQASGKRSSAEGTTTIAKGNYSHAEGDNSVALGSDSHAEGYETTTNGMAAHSEGFKTLANAHSSHSEGFETKTFGDSSHAEGAYSQTLKQYVVAKSGTTSPDVEQSTFDLMATNLSENCGYAAHAEGSSKALGYLAHSQGSSNAYGHYSFASGIGCQTGSLELSQETATEKIYKSNEVGRGAHAFGVGAYAQYNAQTAVGMFNDNKTDSLFEVGNGESHGHRSNAFTVYQDGHAEIMTVGNSDTSVATKGYVDAHVSDASNLENGTGLKAVQGKIQDGKSTFNTNVDGEEHTSGASGEYAVLFGGVGEASGKRSAALGGYNVATGSNTLATGESTKASGRNSVTFGQSTQAQADASVASGYKTVANGINSHAEGVETTTSAEGAHAEGYKTTASGIHSHTEGSNTQATAQGAHAEGTGTQATAEHAHSEGNLTIASGNESHAEGSGSKADGESSHAEGHNTFAGKYTEPSPGPEPGPEPPVPPAPAYPEIGFAAHAESIGTKAYGNGSHAEGYGTIAKTDFSHAEGIYTQANGYGSHAEGNGTIASTSYQLVIGEFNEGKSNTYFEVGSGTSSQRENAFEVYQDGTVGIKNAISLNRVPTSNIGLYSVATGNSVTASANYSHAEGDGTRAVGEGCHAEGAGTHAGGYCSHTEGNNTITVTSYQLAIGEFNEGRTDTYFEVGKGTGSQRENAFTVFRDGHAEVQTVGESSFSVATKKYVDEAVTAESEPAPDVEGEYVRACKVVARKEIETVRDGSIASTHAFSFLVDGFDENCLSAHINITTSGTPARQVCSVDIVFSGMSGECTGSTMTGGALSGTYTIDGADYCLVTLDNAVLSSSNTIRGSIVRLTGEFDKQYYWKKVD